MRKAFDKYVKRFLGYFSPVYALIGGGIGAAISILVFNFGFLGLVLCVLAGAGILGAVGFFLDDD